ncbi:MAG: LVIVD repeat-containing protein [Gemmatimonadales bacterium]
MFRLLPLGGATAAILFGATLAACGGDNGPADPNPPPPPAGDLVLSVVGGGHNVEDRFTSDLWVHGSHAYTGTWGFRGAGSGNAVKIWSLGAGGTPVLADSIVIQTISTVSDIEVSDDGQVLLASAEGGDQQGLYLYSLVDPERPVLLDRELVSTGLHTATFGLIGDRRYVFAAKNPGDPALMIYDVTDPTTITLATSVPVPADYGIHDTFVRDGLAFVFAWNSGVIIYDVGNGIRGGSPSQPVEVSRLVTSDNGIAGGPAVHNGWWFHNPVTQERRYLFIGQEGPATIGSMASGDIHVVDVSNLTAPREVAFYHIDGAGTHNFWMDETRQILYAAYYNAGVVAIDVSGTLQGDLASRTISEIRPGGAQETFTWGVQLSGGSIYASDMISGLWQLKLEETAAAARSP